MHILVFQALLGHRLIGVDGRAEFDGVENLILQSLAPDVGNHLRTNGAALTIQHADDRSLMCKGVLVSADALRPHSRMMGLTLLVVPVLRLATDERLIYLYRAAIRAAQLRPVAILERQADAMQHKPSRLLCDLHIARNLV